MDAFPFVRPPTPQAVLHRAPDKRDAADTKSTRPSRYIILLLAPTDVAGKVQIATSVANSLSCPLFQGDSLHESGAKAASVGASRSDDGGRGRYQRMWFSKMTRTGLLFPEESRPATEGCSGFGGSSSASTSRRGSGSSISSTVSFGDVSTAGSVASSTTDTGGMTMSPGGILGRSQYIHKPVFSLSEEDQRRKFNPALMVLTHPELEAWHKNAIRDATREYGIGILFVPLFDAKRNDEPQNEDEDEIPVLRPFDPRIISGFANPDALSGDAQDVDEKQLTYGHGKAGNLREEMVLKVDVDSNVESIIKDILHSVRDVMYNLN